MYQVRLNLLLAIGLTSLLGCEGNGPRPSSFNSSSGSSASNATALKMAPVSKSGRPAVNNADNNNADNNNADNNNADNNPAVNNNGGNNNGNRNPKPAANTPELDGFDESGAKPGAAAPAVTIDSNKLETIRQTLMFHSAMLLQSEVGNVVTGSYNENLNFVTRAHEGFSTIKLIKAMDLYKANNNGKPPQTVEAFIKMLADNLIEITELNPNGFYVYDPEAAAQEKNKELEYFRVFTP